MACACTHPVNVIETDRTATPTATHFSASDCGGYPIPQPNRHKVTGCAGTRRPMHAVSVYDRSRAQAPTSAYWGPQDCGGGSEPRPSGYKSNDFCECRMRPARISRSVTTRPRSAYNIENECIVIRPQDQKATTSLHRGISHANYSASEECGCTQNATGSACW